MSEEVETCELCEQPIGESEGLYELNDQNVCLSCYSSAIDYIYEQLKEE